jgi:hypothetical protein
MEKFKWARAHMSAGRDRYDQTQAITTARGHVTEHRSPLVATMRVPLLPQPHRWLSLVASGASYVISTPGGRVDADRLVHRVPLNLVG